MGCRMSTPIRVLHAESNIPYLQQRSKLLAEKFSLKLLSFENHQLHQHLAGLYFTIKDTTHYGETLNNFTLIKAYLEVMKNTSLVKKYDTPLPYPFDYENLVTDFSDIIDFSLGVKLQNAEDIKQTLEDNLVKFPSEENFYTDGSKINKDNDVGAASLAHLSNSCILLKLPPETSIFTAEATALRETLKFILEQEIKIANVFIDSQSLLKAICSSSFKNQNSYLIHEIKELLIISRKSNLLITLIWIPSHKGIPGNELADSLAKEAIKIGEKIEFKIPYSDLNSKINSKFKKFHLTRLKNIDTDKGNYYFDNFFQEKNHTWFKYSPYTRRHIVTIIRLRSNHHSLQESLHRKNIISSPLCTFCNSAEGTIDHILWICPEFDGARSWLLTNLKKSNNYFPCTSTEFLKDPNSPLAKVLVDFIVQKCKIFI